jgi:hypothetical protein
MSASVNLLFMFVLLSVDSWLPSPLAACACSQEKERTRTDAELIAVLHIKTSSFPWRRVVSKTDVASVAHGQTMQFGMECTDSSRHGSIHTRSHESRQYREMGRLLPWNTCQYLKKKGIGCSRYAGRREERTAKKGMKAVSSKQT